MAAPIIIALYALLEAVAVAAARGVLAALLLQIDKIKEAYDLLIDEIERVIFDMAEYLIIASLEEYFQVVIGTDLNAETLTKAINQKYGLAFTDLTSREQTEADALKIAVQLIAQALQIDEVLLLEDLATGVKTALTETAEKALKGDGALGGFATVLQDALNDLIGDDFVMRQSNEIKNNSEPAQNARDRQSLWRIEHSPYKWVKEKG